MKQPLYAFLFCLVLAIAYQARCATLPSACGDDKVKFMVTTQPGQPAPAPPAAGRAQVVIVETVFGMSATARIGMDGAWVGADKGNSYFTLDVPPGLHHLCANWQSSFNAIDRQVQLFALDAEPGNVYYFHVKAVSTKYDLDFTLAPLNVDEATYLIQTSGFSTSAQKK